MIVACFNTRQKDGSREKIVSLELITNNNHDLDWENKTILANLFNYFLAVDSRQLNLFA